MMMRQSQLPVGIQYVQALGPTLVALVVGFIAAALTYWQWKTARDKVRLDLFEKRYAIYRETLKVLATALQNGTVTYNEVTEFYRNTRGAELLFGSDVEGFIDEVRDHLNKLAYHEGLIHQGPDVAGYESHVDASADLMLEVEKLLIKTTRSKFEAYLSFGHLK